MSLPVFLAPLQGFTDSAWRRAFMTVCGGVETCYSPFLRLEHGEVRRKDFRDISNVEELGVLVPQVIVADAAELRALCAAAREAGHSRIDMNLGCPFPMQTRLGRGSGMLARPQVLEKVLQEAAVLTREEGFLFSVKMRLGLESADEWRVLMPMLNAAPLEHVTLHPRVGRQQYKGSVDMGQFAAFVSECVHPAVYNGDLLDIEGMQDVEAQFPNLRALMLGRGLLARPTLAQEYASGQKKTEDEVRDCVLSIHEIVFDEYCRTLEGGEAQVLQKMQPFWEYPGGLFDRKMVKRIVRTSSLDAYRQYVRSL